MYSGYSFTTFDDLCVYLLTQIQPKRVLDIGAGEGKYGHLIRAANLPQPHLTAVEYEPARKDELLALGYDEVRSISALSLMEHPEETFDFVILGDVIEHFRKSEGQDLLEYLNYRCKFILIVTPECMPMSSPNFYEGHNSLWRPQSMQWHDLWAHCRNNVMHFYLLRGYLGMNEDPSMRDLVKHVNAQPFMQQRNSEHQTTQVRQLTLHDTISLDLSEDQSHHIFFRPI